MTSRRSISGALLAAVIAAGLSSCAGQQLSLGRFLNRPGDAETITTHPDAEEVALNPADEQSSRRSPFLDPPGETRADQGGQREADGPYTNAFDYDTAELIRKELADAPPSERREWYDTLSRVDPDMVPHLLALRKARAATGRDHVGEPYSRDDADDEFRTARRHPLDGYVSSEPDGSPPPTLIRPAATESRERPDERMVSRDPYRPMRSPFERDPAGGGMESVAPDRGLDVGARRQDASTRPVVRSAWPPNDGLSEARPGLHGSGAQGSAADPGSTLAERAGARSRDGRPVDPRRSGYLEMPEYPETTSQPVMPTEAIQQTSAVSQDGRYALSNDWDTQLQRVIGIIEDDLAKRPTPQTDAERAMHTELHAYLRMLYLMDGQQTRSLQAIPDMPETHQEFWTQLFWGLTNYFDRDGIPDAGHRATETITQLRSAIEKLKPESRLQLRNATFSHQINSFGNYERFDRDEFRAGQPVLVYVEVQNFASEMGSEGLYRTRLRTSVEIHKAGRGPDAGLVFSDDYPATEDTCRNLRQDYFHSYRLDLPENLTPGPHTLKLIVEDELSHRITSTSLSFTIQ